MRAVWPCPLANSSDSCWALSALHSQLSAENQPIRISKGTCSLCPLLLCGGPSGQLLTRVSWLKGLGTWCQAEAVGLEDRPHPKLRLPTASGGSFLAWVLHPFYRTYLRLDFPTTSAQCNIYWSISFSRLPKE